MSTIDKFLARQNGKTSHEKKIINHEIKVWNLIKVTCTL